MRIEYVLGIAVSLLAFGFYLFTLSPTVNFLDSGELITVGATAGVAHPPGYPLYTLLLIVVAALPLGDVAVRVNGLSALMGAVAVGLFYTLLYELLTHHLHPRSMDAEPPLRTSRRVAPPPGAIRRSSRTTPAPDAPPVPDVPPTAPASPTNPHAAIAAFGAAGLLGASLTFWNWATQAKMYTLHFAFVALLLWGALRVRRAWRTAGTPGRAWPPAAWGVSVRPLLALAFATGLALTNHGMTLWLLPALAILLLWPGQPGAGDDVPGTERAAPPWRWLLAYAPLVLIAGLLPLLLYLYLPLRAGAGPVMNWGAPATWADFWRHVTAWQFRVYIGNVQPLDYLADAGRYAIAQWGLGLGTILWLLAVGGLLRLARHNRAMLCASAAVALLTVIFALNYQIREVIVYYVPLYMMILLWTGVGLDGLLQAAGAWLEQQMASDAPAPDAPATTAQPARNPAQFALVTAVFPLLLVAAAFAWNVGRAGHRNDYLADAYVRNQFKTFGPNALVLTDNWDLVSPGYYLQQVRGERRDVVLVDKNLMRYPFYLDYLDRTYPQTMARVQKQEAAYRVLNRQWLDSGGTTTPPGLQAAYMALLRALVEQALGAEEPVYYQWIAMQVDQIGQEEQTLAQGLNVSPEGLAFHITHDPVTAAPADPQFDWRGILTDPVAKDEVAHSVVDFYPIALARLAKAAAQKGHSTEAQQLAGQATTIAAALGVVIAVPPSAPPFTPTPVGGTR